MAADELFFDEAFDAIFGHATVPESFGVDDQDGAPLADTKAVGFGTKTGVGTGRQGDLSVLEDALEPAPCGVTGILSAAGVSDAEEDVANEVADFEICGDGLQWVHDQYSECRGLKT